MILMRSLILVLLVALLNIAPMGIAYGDDTASPSPSEATLLINDKYHIALLQRINGAQSEIIVGAYIFKTSPRAGLPGVIMEALATAVRRGVKVRVLLEQSGDKDSLNAFNQDTARKLLKRNILVCFDSLGQTTHSKLFVIDGRYVFVGSHNLTPSGLGRNNEVSVLIDSPKLALAAKKYLYDVCRQQGASR